MLTKETVICPNELPNGAGGWSTGVEVLPACGSRTDCRWWNQEGPAACRRCPQVVTFNPKPSVYMRVAADPKQM